MTRFRTGRRPLRSWEQDEHVVFDDERKVYAYAPNLSVSVHWAQWFEDHPEMVDSFGPWWDGSTLPNVPCYLSPRDAVVSTHEQSEPESSADEPVPAEQPSRYRVTVRLHDGKSYDCTSTEPGALQYSDATGMLKLVGLEGTLQFATDSVESVIAMQIESDEPDETEDNFSDSVRLSIATLRKALGNG